MKRMLSIVLVILMLAVPFAAQGAEPTKGDAIGMSIMGFSTTDIYNNPVDDSIIDDTAVTVFNFWATWCGPCVSEMPHFNQLYQQYAATPEADVQIVGVVVDPSDVSSAVTFVAQNNYNWLQLKRCSKFMELLSTTADSSGSISIPQTIIVDYQGTVLDHFIGSQSYNSLYQHINTCYQYVMNNYPPTPVLLGDADGNGQLNANDALSILRMALGLVPVGDIAVVDIDGNGVLNANDALVLMRQVLGL